MQTALRLLGDRRGATSIEYALLVALVAVGLLTTMNAVGARIRDVFAAVSAVGDAPPPGNISNGA